MGEKGKEGKKMERKDSKIYGIILRTRYKIVRKWLLEAIRMVIHVT